MKAQNSKCIKRIHKGSVPLCLCASVPRLWAFSLIEVNLAILVIALGLLALFALFPLGLRESEMGIIDTHEAMFADHVLSSMEGNALAITNWSTWINMMAFINGVESGIYPIDPIYGYGWSRTALADAINFPTNAVDRYLRYKLTILDYGARKTAELRVKSGKYGDFDRDAHVYLTEFIYFGM